MEALTTATRRDSSVRMCSKAAVSSVRSPAWAAALQCLHGPAGLGQEAQARPGDQARGISDTDASSRAHALQLRLATVACMQSIQDLVDAVEHT